MNVLGFHIDRNYPTFPIKQKIIINTINPHSYCVAKKDQDFQEALKASDMLIPDGTGIVWAARILEGQRIKRITGADMHSYLLERAQVYGLKVFYMGSTEGTLQKIEEKILKEYPGIEFSSYSPPYKAEFSKSDSKKMIGKVNNFSPDILFVGMTAPKQEKWVHQNKDLLDATITCSIGAVFDFFAGTVKRSPEWMQKMGMEWLHRSLTNPSRLGKRNLKSNPEFMVDVFKEKLGLRR